MMKNSVCASELPFLTFFSPQVCTLFNMFVMYGDTFLPNPSSYDELYYELLRQVSIIVTC